MKKFISLSLTIIFIFSSFTLGLTALAAGKEYLVVNSEGADLYIDRQSFSQKIARVPEGTIVKSLDQTAEFVKVLYEGFLGWVLHKDIIEYEPADKNIEKITLEGDYKKEYYENGKYWAEPFDSEGLVVVAHYKDGTTKTVENYTLYPPVMSEPNSETEVYVNYRGHYAKFNVNIQKHPIDRIEIEKEPDNTSFKEGSGLDLNGIVVKVYYTDPAWEPRTLEIDDLLVEGYDKNKPGGQTVKIIYKYDEVYADLEVYVIEKVLEKIEITQKPYKVNYYGEDRQIDATGLKVLARYDNGFVKEISPAACSYKWKEKNPKYDEKTEIVVSYTEKSVLDPEKTTTKSTTYEITLHTLRAIGLRVEPPTRRNYLKGEKLDLQGFQLYLEYNSGKEELISAGFEMDKPDLNIAGNHIVNIKYKGFKASFVLHVWSTRLYGDVDFNQKVTASDARRILRGAAKLETFNEEQKIVASMGRSTHITASHARLALRIAAKLDSPIYIFEI